MSLPRAAEDVVEQGRRDGRRSGPPWLRRAAVVLAAAGGLAWLGQAGLLSAQRPEPVRPGPARATAAGQPSDAAGEQVALALDGRRLLRLHAGATTPLGELPPGAREPFAVVPAATGPDHAGGAPGGAAAPYLLLGVVRGRLLGLDPRALRGTDLGPATRIVAVSAAPPGVFVRGATAPVRRVALVSAFSGQVVDPDPFPGYGDLRGWAARGVVTTFGVDALVLSRPTGDEGEELAVAWAEKLLPRSRAPRLQLLGAPGRLLGLAGEWLLVLAGRCPSDGCRLKVLSFTRDGFRLRQVRPPEGWSFAPGPVSGQAHEALVPLRELGPPHRQGLGRLVPAGRGALLVSGSAGVEPAAGVWADQGGSVYAVQPRGADRRVVRWSPFAPAGLALVPGVPPLPAGARLVCVCG